MLRVPPTGHAHARSQDALALGVLEDCPEDPPRPRDDQPRGAPEPHHAHLQRAAQVHAEDGGDHGAQRGGKGGDGQQQLQAVDLGAGAGEPGGGLVRQDGRSAAAKGREGEQRLQAVCRGQVRAAWDEAIGTVAMSKGARERWLGGDCLL